MEKIYFDAVSVTVIFNLKVSERREKHESKTRDNCLDNGGHNNFAG